MMSAERKVCEYECVGGPLDGKMRRAKAPPADDRLYVVAHEGGNGKISLVEADTVPPYAGWELLGCYVVADDENPRRGIRRRLWWRSAAKWPSDVIIPPWKPEPPQPLDFDSDSGDMD